MNIKTFCNESLRLQDNNRVYAKSLLKTKDIVDVPVEVSLHKTLNTSKVVIRSRELSKTTEQEMLAELSNTGLIKVEYVYVTRDQLKVKTNTMFLTYNRPNPPEYVYVGSTYLRVST